MKKIKISNRQRWFHVSLWRYDCLMVKSTRWSLANQPISKCEKHFENERFVMDEAEGSKKREREEIKRSLWTNIIWSNKKLRKLHKSVVIFPPISIRYRGELGSAWGSQHYSVWKPYECAKVGKCAITFNISTGENA